MIRLTFFFSTDNFTWTESHYHVSANTIAAADLDAANLYDARLKILTKPAAMVASRLSDTAKPRLAQTSVPNGGQDIGEYVPQGSSTQDQYSDRPYSSIIVEYVGKNGYTSRGFMSGVPDDAVSQDPGEVGGIDPTWGPLWRTAFTTYMGVLASNWGWRRLDPTATVPVIGLDIATLPNGEVGIQTQNQLTFNPTYGQFVNLTGFRSVNPRKKGLRGIYAVDASVPGGLPTAPPWKYYLRGTTLAQAQNVTQQLGKVCPLAYTIEQYSTGQPIKATHRKRGVRALAPLGRSRGRPC